MARRTVDFVTTIAPYVRCDAPDMESCRSVFLAHLDLVGRCAYCHLFAGEINKTQLSGFGSLAGIPEEKITDKISRRVLSGRQMLDAGGIAVFPGGIEHEGWCHEDTEVVDIFAPPCEDFLAGGGPTWLREEKLKSRTECAVSLRDAG